MFSLPAFQPWAHRRLYHRAAIQGRPARRDDSGDVILEALRTAAAEVATLSGDITVRGALSIDGVFDLSALPGTPDAVFSLRSIRGQVLAALARPPEQTGDRLELVSGGGGATVRAVTYSGTIRIE